MTVTTRVRTAIAAAFFLLGVPPRGDPADGLAATPRLAGHRTGSPPMQETPPTVEQQRDDRDLRLSHPVTLALKGAALSALCETLSAQSGVSLQAGRTVADEKVTAFCEKQPLRDVMHEVNRLFGYTWLRTKKVLGHGSSVFGKGPADLNTQHPTPNTEYRYELVQDLRSQLLEEELRNKDSNAALLALDGQMQPYRRYVEEGFSQVKQRWEQAGKRPGLGPISGLMMDGIWGAVQLYFRLTPRDRAALVAGQELVFRPDDPDPDHRLPDEWHRPLLESWHSTVGTGDGRHIRLADVPGVQVYQVRLKLRRSELGRVSLNSRLTAVWNDEGIRRQGSIDRELATGHSPSVAEPGNAAANAALEGRPPFDRMASLKPEISCPALKRARSGRNEPQLYSVSLRGPVTQPHVFSSDVWEAVHRATGLPVMADFYTRLYPLPAVSAEGKTLFEALCTVGDALGVRWRKGDRFLLGRSTSYFWDKLKEVPNRYLQRWSQDRDASGGLPLADLLQMATLSDQQLDSAFVGEGIEHCWRLPEWGQIGGAPLEERVLRPYGRFLATLGPEQLRRALELTGLPFTALTPAQQQAAMQLEYWFQETRDRDGAPPRPRRPEDQAELAVTLDYIPSGWYAWMPPRSTPENSYVGPLRPFGGRTPAEALAAVRRLDPPVDPPSSLEQVEYVHSGIFSPLINPVDHHWGIRRAGG